MNAEERRFSQKITTPRMHAKIPNPKKAANGLASFVFIRG